VLGLPIIPKMSSDVSANASFWRVSGLMTSSICVAFAIGVSVRLLYAHSALTGVDKRMQYLNTVIIAMVPLFAFDSLVGLLDWDASETFILVLDSVKECYEAYVIKCFLELLYLYMNISWKAGIDGKRQWVIPERIRGKHLHHSFPFQYVCPDLHVDAHGLETLHLYATQFVYLRPITSIIELIAELNDVESWVHWPFLIALNVSVTLAVYALIMFYHAFADDRAFKAYRPFAKFICIKGIVFFAFWQGVVLEVLVSLGILHEDHFWTVDELEIAISNWLVTLEMGFLFSFAFQYGYAAELYPRKEEPKKDQ